MIQSAHNLTASLSSYVDTVSCSQVTPWETSRMIRSSETQTCAVLWQRRMRPQPETLLVPSFHKTSYTTTAPTLHRTEQPNIFSYSVSCSLYDVGHGQLSETPNTPCFRSPIYVTYLGSTQSLLIAIKQNRNTDFMQRSFCFTFANTDFKKVAELQKSTVIHNFQYATWGGAGTVPTSQFRAWN